MHTNWLFLRKKIKQKQEDWTNPPMIWSKSIPSYMINGGQKLSLIKPVYLQSCVATEFSQPNKNIWWFACIIFGMIYT